MTERDLERVLTQSVQDMHLSDAARRHIRQATREKEANPVKMKKFVAIALAMVLALSATVAVATELGMFDFLARMMGQEVLPEAHELLKSDVAYGETEHVTYTVKQAVYDGKSVSMLVEMQAKDEETFLLGRNWHPDAPISQFIDGLDNDPRTVAQYAADNGYTRLVEATVDNGDTYHSIEEWNNNVLTLLCTYNIEAEEVTLNLAYSEDDYGTNMQRIPFEITLKACEPLWTVKSEQSFDVPNFGIRIDGVTVIGTPLQSYFYIDYTVTSYQQHNSFGWNADLVGMDKEYLPRGVLGTGGTNHEGGTGMGQARWGGQHMTWYDSFGAMETPPTELMILLRNWENFDLNEYYPITLK